MARIPGNYDGHYQSLSVASSCCSENRVGGIGGYRRAARLRVPSIGLLVVSGIVATIGVVQFPFVVAMLILEMNGIYHWGYWSTGAISWPDKIAMIAMHASNFFIVFGAWQMLLGRNYRLSYAAAILASIPFLSTFVICGIPFGIWALIVLHRRDVKEAFARGKNPVASEQLSRNSE